MAIIRIYGGKISHLYLLLTSTEIIILKVFYIYKFSTIAAVNEYFLKTFLILFNVVVIGVNVVIRIEVKEFGTSPNVLSHCQNPCIQLAAILNDNTT